MVSHQLHWRLFESITFLVKNFPSLSPYPLEFITVGASYLPERKQSKGQSEWMFTRNCVVLLVSTLRHVRLTGRPHRWHVFVEMCESEVSSIAGDRLSPLSLSTVKVLTSLLNFARREYANSKHVLTVSSSITYLSTFGRVHSRFSFLTRSFFFFFC